MSRRRRTICQAVFDFAVSFETCKRCGSVLPKRGECGGCLSLDRSESEIRDFLSQNPDPLCTKQIVRALSLCDTSREAEAEVDDWIEKTKARIRENWSEETHRERHWTGGNSPDLVWEPVTMGE